MFSKKGANDVIRLAPFYISALWNYSILLAPRRLPLIDPAETWYNEQGRFYHFVVSYTMRTPRDP